MIMNQVRFILAEIGMVSVLVGSFFAGTVPLCFSLSCVSEPGLPEVSQSTISLFVLSGFS